MSLASALVVLALGAPPSPVVAAPAAEVSVTYLANEGVRVHGACDVLVDALQRDSLGAYARHARDVQEALETASPPFDGVRLALATHFHLDHWDPGAISRFLRSSAEATFASTPQATAMMPYELRERVKPLWPADGRSPVAIEGGGARVEAFPLEHGQTQNLAYRIGCGGRTVAHLGDASPSPANFERLLAAGPVDVALVPFWWLADEEGRRFVKERWRPAHVVAFHVGAEDSRYAERIRRDMPDAWVCTKPGETRRY